MAGACSGCRDAVREASANALGGLARLLSAGQEASVGVKAAHLIASLAVGNPINQRELTREGVVLPSPIMLTHVPQRPLV